MGIQFFSPSEWKATITVETENGKVLQKFQQKTFKGFNIASYDVTLSEKGKKELGKESDKIKKADNDKYYLPKGKYVVNISASGKTTKTSLEVK